MKNFKTEVSKYFKKFDNKLSFTVPNEVIFRLLGNYKFNFYGKNCLDIGIGNGDNLLEFKRRGANIYGIDIRKNIINQFVKNNKLNKQNFYICDLNYNFPKINKKMNYINCKDTLCYIELKKQYDLFKEIYNLLNDNGLFLFQYHQTDLIVKNKNLFSYNLIKSQKKINFYMEQNNPAPFLKNNHILRLINSQKFKILQSIFDINTHIKKSKIIIINRYFLLKKE